MTSTPVARAKRRVTRRAAPDPLARPEPSPFVKWAGGKAQLLPAYDALLPEDLRGRGYHEPFVGGGAMFFHLSSQGLLDGPVALSDSNADLIALWRIVRDEPRELHRKASRLFARHSTEHYYQARDRFNNAILHPVDNAALLLYLNKAGFNGLYRVNAEGRFNVPCGRQASPPAVPPRALLIACSEALQGVDVADREFTTVLDRADRGDFVYFDPPYVPLPGTPSFTDYTKGGFGPAQQEALRDCFATLARRGCLVMLSNSGTAEVRRLYAGFRLHAVSARRSINSRGSARGPVGELVVTSW